MSIVLASAIKGCMAVGTAMGFDVDRPAVFGAELL